MLRTKIEVVGARGIPGVAGGVESHCEELLPRIAEIAGDLDIEIIARERFVGRGATTYRGVSVRPLYAPRKQGAEALVSTFLGIIRASRRGARLVHIHGIGPALLAPLARLLGMRVVVTHHSVNYEHSKWNGFERFLLRLGERSAMTWAHAVIAVAPWLFRRLHRQYPAQASIISFIPNGFPTFPASGKDSATLLRRIGVENREFILAVGRLVPEKNFELLIEACQRVPGATLVIAGGSDHEDDYARALRARAGRRTIFTGKLDRSALRILYESAARFVLPSTHEGMPLVAIEAALLGCPMLLSDIEANRDLQLPENNYFRAGDVDDLVRRLIAPPGELAGTNRMRDRFDWNRIAKATVDVYRRALD